MSVFGPLFRFGTICCTKFFDPLPNKNKPGQVTCLVSLVTTNNALPLSSGRSKNSKMVFNMSDLVCPHHREFASRFFDSSSDSEWDSDDSYYDYDTDDDEEDSDGTAVVDSRGPTPGGIGPMPGAPLQGVGAGAGPTGDFFYSFHSHGAGTACKAGGIVGAGANAASVNRAREPGVPDRPAPCRVLEATRVSLKIGWDPPNCNGAPITYYILEMDMGAVAGADFHEIYKGNTIPHFETLQE